MRTNMNDIEYIFLVVVLLIIAVCMLAITVSAPVSNDEHMYITAGVLTQSHTLYKDFAYLQMPYLPLVYAGIYAVTGTEYYLLYARIFTFLTVFASAVVLFILGYKITGNFAFSLMGVLLYSFSGITIHSLGYASNAAPPVLFSLLAVYFFLRVRFGGGVRPMHVFLAGLFIAFACGVKLYYIVIMIPLIISTFIFPGSYSFWSKLRYSFVPLLAGFIAGILPVVYYYLIDPQLFTFYNIGFHQIKNELFTGNTYFSAGNTPAAYSILTYITWEEILPVILITVMAVFSLVLNFRSKSDLYHKYIVHKRNFIVCGVLTAALLPALQPWTLWQHYLAYPFPFIILFLYAVYTILDGRYKRIFVTVVVSASLYVIVYAVPGIVLPVQNITITDRWVPVQYHHAARAVTLEIPDDAKIAAFDPLLALEGGRQVYPEFSSGYFVYHLTDTLHAGGTERYGILSPSSFPEWLMREQPAAIIIPNQHKFNPIVDHGITTGSYSRFENNNNEYSIYLLLREGGDKY
jgi:hypothetical protein